MELQELLCQLRHTPAFTRNVTYWHVEPARSARLTPIPSQFDPRLLTALRNRGVQQLYSHQANAIGEVMAGQDVVLVTPAASGKTLAYNLPVLQHLLNDQDARALYLFPTKALANDQLSELRATLKDIRGAPIVHTYDGDTPSSARPAIRRTAQILITNPDMLHAGILPHHTRWAEFFRGLRFVVIDELHTYRGVFGSHVANVLRRLARVCNFYGGRTQYIGCSATIANPAQLAEALIERSVILVDEDGSPSGERHFIFYNPPIVNPELGIRRSLLLEARNIAGRFLEANIPTIVFGRSRLSTEVLLTYVREWIARRHISPDIVRGYRGGYLPSQRREIERGLRQGDVRGVVATTALELGIDIGQLSAVILAGYPGSVASTLQQAGRAGRRAGVSVAVFVASASPLDLYIVGHPEYFFGRRPERGLIAPDNLAILISQLQCAAFELPFQKGEPFGRFADTDEVLSYLEGEGMLRLSAGRWHWMSEGYPAQQVSLRTASTDTFVILAQDVEDAGTRAIGQLDRASVPILLHQGAVYIHEGQSYLVESLDWDAGVAHVRVAAVDFYTEAAMATSIRVSEVLATAPEGCILKGHGLVTVRSKTNGYKKIKLHTHEVLGRGVVDLPEMTMPTGSFWLRFPQAAVERLRAAGAWQGEPLLDYGPDWPHQRRRARQRDHFRCVHCGAVEEDGRQHEVHHLRPFREFSQRTADNGHLAANHLDNLVTLCSRCHRLVESARQLRGTLAGLAHVLRHVAPLHLTCDPRDLGVSAESSGLVGEPTLYIYDRAPAGLGFSGALFDLQEGTLLGGVADILQRCRCQSGCPSCVGPSGELSGDVKKHVFRLVQTVLDHAIF